MYRDPTSILMEYWGHESFRGSQEMIVQRLLDGGDAVALMPTGGGKSICYQVPAMAREGLCIVVSPLVALIQDQVAQLKARGIKAISLAGGIRFEELGNLLDNCLYGNYKFLYLSPERLQQSMVQERIQGMNINLLAVDEAHCISQWGNDFRPAYLHCSLLRELVPGVPMVALTATATPKVLDDILENLKLERAEVFKDSYARSNIAFKVKQTGDKLGQLKKYLHKDKGSAIVYVRSRKLCVSLSGSLNREGIPSAYFHGGIPKSEKDEKRVLWTQGEIRVMVATNAFGMGVDKADVRLVIHYQVPDSLESYYQEAGRAGRDAMSSTSIILWSKEDREAAQRLYLSSLPGVEEVKQVYSKLNNHFQISYGELPQGPLTFKFEEFCGRYGFQSTMAFNALRILDQNSVLSLSDTFTERHFLRFVGSKAEIYGYLNRNRKSAAVVQTILRTYGGITQFDTGLDLKLLSRKTGESESTIKTIMQQLSDDGLAVYSQQSSDLEISFLVPREDDHTIYTFSRKIEDLNRIKRDNLKAMLGYIENKKQCRNQLLLNYFGENGPEKCGSCDICNKREKKASMPQLEDRILGLLQLSPSRKRVLAKATDTDKKTLGKVLQRMLAAKKIQINANNEYSLKE